ncbi:MAG: magnesium chelatase [Bacillota bacterium]
MGRGVPLRHPGNESLFLAVEMSLTATLAGVPLHVHAEGLRGTGKTTVMRWAKRAMPEITRVAGCAYGCDPASPHCPSHRGGGNWGSESVPMPFVEVGHGAKLGTILGSIDLGRLTGKSGPEASLLPGSIPMAHRGIIFIDEVNRLAETAPEITDVLLSVMGTKPGVVKIEEVGLPPCEIEVLASVWAASNPDEDPGPLDEIRKQLADRFDLVVPVQRPSDPAVVERLLFGSAENPEETRVFGDLHAAAARLAGVVVPPYIVRYMSQLYVHRNVESLRAVEALELTARLNAAMKEKDEVSFDDLLTVLPLVLRHRVEPSVLSEILKDLELRRAAGTLAKPPSPPQGPQDAEVAETHTAVSGMSGDQGEARAGGAETPTDGARTQPEMNAATLDQESPPSPQSPSARTYSWFEKLVDRYRRASGSWRPARAPGGNSPATRLPDPATMKPVSPPDRAKRLTSLAWPDMVTPPDWRDRLL